MVSTKAVILALTCGLIVSAYAATWTVVDNDYATIAMAVSFLGPTTGWVAGGSGSLQPLLLYTTDAGKTFNNSGIADSSTGAFLAISMANANNGIAGSLGFFGLPCGAYTNDGKTWYKTHEGKDIFCAAQDAAATDGGNTMMIIGEWSDPTNFAGNGVQVSLDAGKTWNGHNWNQGTDARYGWFASKDQGYVAGGMWPATSSQGARKISSLFGARPSYPISRHLHYDGRRMNVVRSEATKAVGDVDVSGYQAIIAYATNSASQYNTVLNLTGQGVYFNQISCVDVNTCWAVAEGTNKTNGYDAAYVYFTNNGWKTFSTQLYVEGGSLAAITMLNSTFGWAGGALVQSTSDSPDAASYGQFWLTTDGKTWTLNQEIRNFYVFDISVIDGANAYAAGVTNLGLSSLARFN